MYRAINLHDRIEQHQTRNYKTKENEEKKRAAINTELVDIIQLLNGERKCRLRAEIEEEYKRLVKETAEYLVKEHGLKQAKPKAEKDVKVNTLEETPNNTDDIAKVENESKKKSNL